MLPKLLRNPDALIVKGLFMMNQSIESTESQFPFNF